MLSVVRAFCTMTMDGTLQSHAQKDLVKTRRRMLLLDSFNCGALNSEGDHVPAVDHCQQDCRYREDVKSSLWVSMPEDEQPCELMNIPSAISHFHANL